MVEIARKKLYACTVTVELMVYAADERTAKRLALRHANDELEAFNEVRVEEAKAPLPGWRQSLPYGDDAERTVEQIFREESVR